MTIQGGYWHTASYPYPAPADFVFGTPYRKAFDLDDCNHPREFIYLEYNGRGAYREVYVPVRIRGKVVIEPIEHPVWRLIGKEAAPPEKVVSEVDLEAFYHLPANPCSGSCTIAFRNEMHNKLEYFAPPVIKGIEVDDFTDVLAGLEAFTLTGGQYVRLSEMLPNGEQDWLLSYYALHDMAKETGWQPDLARLFFYPPDRVWPGVYALRSGQVINAWRTQIMARAGAYGVYMLPPNAGDRFGVWLNDPQFVDADYYIPPRVNPGASSSWFGRRSLTACFIHTGRGLTTNGVGWAAFTRVIRRVQEHLHDQVVWMRPSEYTDSLLKV
jgi:hypothetical protein